MRIRTGRSGENTTSCELNVDFFRALTLTI